jgi:hypothetical protein
LQRTLEMGRSTSKRAVRWEAYERHWLPLCNVSCSWWKREDAGIRPAAQTMVPTPFRSCARGKTLGQEKFMPWKRTVLSPNDGSWRLIAWSSGRSSLQQGLSNHLTGFQLLASEIGKK